MVQELTVSFDDTHSMHRIKNLFEWHEYDIMLMLGVYNVILNV